MKLELKENMYYRTTSGHIGKIVSLRYFNEREYLLNGFYTNKDTIKKASYNIIDLIEEGDYVNGEKVLETNCKWEYTDDDSENGVNEVYDGLELEKGRIYFEDEIETIVTKEQFKQMQYTVEK